MWAFLGTPRKALASTCFVYSVPLLFCYLLGWVDYRRILYPVLLKFEEARKDSPVFACGTVVRSSHIFPAPFRPNWLPAVEKESKPLGRFVTPVFEKFSCSLLAAFSLLFFALLESWLCCYIFSFLILFFVRPETVGRLRFSRISRPLTPTSL